MVKNLLSIFVFVLLLVTYISCSCSKCDEEQKSAIPVEILKSADNFIISYTGVDFFKENIKVDFHRSKFTAPYFEMVYWISMVEKPYVHNKILFSVDTLGGVVKEREIIGLPDCINNPSGCEFNINEEEAREIARECGLEQGIKEWMVGFLWNEKHKKYVWHILNTLTASEGSQGFRGSGKEIMIDPFNGFILELNEWSVK